MKFAVLLSVLCFYYVYGEQCTVNSDCASTKCDTQTHVICQHPDTSDGVQTNGGLCTCRDNNSTCIIASDCFVDTVSLSCANKNRHCYDNKCICDRFIIN